MGALMQEAGASPEAASAAWVANAIRWVSWKLARWERRLPLMAGRLLTRRVILDQLMHRQPTASPPPQRGLHPIALRR